MKKLNPVLFSFILLFCESETFPSDYPGAYKDLQPSDLPIIITKTDKIDDNAPLAFFISGDGGWYNFEQSIADKLSVYGIPTIGLDTKIYFRGRRTPAETTADVLSCLSYYGDEMHKKNIIFIGYSLGAELVPFIISRLPPAIQARVKMYVMLSPASTTDFEVHLSDKLGIANSHDTYQVIEEIKKISSVPAVCIFGSDEKTKVPSLLNGTDVKIVVIPGDHHYKSDTDLIVETMKASKAF